MDPPGFLRSLQARGLDRAYCRECVHFAHEKERGGSICLEYGVVIFLYSTCDDFIRRVGSDSPVVSGEEITKRFPLGLEDLTKQPHLETQRAPQEPSESG
jgi:hypothetical protein